MTGIVLIPLLIALVVVAAVLAWEALPGGESNG